MESFDENSMWKGLVGFIFSLIALLASFLTPKSIMSIVIISLFFIIGLIFSILQRKVNKTKLSTAGLIISIIGILLVIFFTFIAPFIVGGISGSVKADLDRQLAEQGIANLFLVLF